MRALKKSGSLTTLQGAKLMQRTAKKLAPKKTGETMRGIRRRKNKLGWTVESLVRGRFKQNLFANQTAPFRTLRFIKPNKFFASPQTVVYGQSATTPGGKSVVWTGKPRFWHFASLRTRKFVKKISIKNTRSDIEDIPPSAFTLFLLPKSICIS